MTENYYFAGLIQTREGSTFPVQIEQRLRELFERLPGVEVLGLFVVEAPEGATLEQYTQGGEGDG